MLLIQLQATKEALLKRRKFALANPAKTRANKIN